MKKILISLVALIGLTLAVTTTTFAHRGHGNRHNQITQQMGYAPCTVADCEIEHSHQHNQNWYCGKAGLDGQYKNCSVTDCSAIGLHEHDGEYYHHRNYGNRTPRRNNGGCHRR